MTLNKILIGFCTLGLLLWASACAFNLNFTGGGSVDPNIKTLSITPFSNESPLAVTYHGQLLTEQLRDRFLTQSRLTLVNNNGDVQLSGAITSYSISPVAIQGATSGAIAAQNRLAVTVKVKYENKITPSENWEQPFNRFIDFSANSNFSSIERELIQEINDQITQDIFSKSLGKW